MGPEIGQGLGVESLGPQGDVLAGAAELREVELDGIDQGDRLRVVDDRVVAARLGGPGIQGQQCGFGDAGEGDPMRLGIAHSRLT